GTAWDPVCPFVLVPPPAGVSWSHPKVAAPVEYITVTVADERAPRFGRLVGVIVEHVTLAELWHVRVKVSSNVAVVLTVNCVLKPEVLSASGGVMSFTARTVIL